MRLQVASTVRSAALRRRALRPGEGVFDRVEIGTVGREVEQLRAGGLDGGAHGSALVAAEVVHHDDVARLEFRDKDLVDIGLEGGAVDRPVERHRRGPIPVRRSAPTNVVVFPWRSGMAARNRSPSGARPELRAMVVDAQVSSMKTSPSGSRSSWPSNPSCRRLMMCSSCYT